MVSKKLNRRRHQQPQQVRWVENPLTSYADWSEKIREIIIFLLASGWRRRRIRRIRYGSSDDSDQDELVGGGGGGGAPVQVGN